MADEQDKNGIIIPTNSLDPGIIFSTDNITAKADLTIQEIGTLSVARTLAAYEKDHDIDVLATLACQVLELTRSRKGGSLKGYIDAVKIRIMSMRNLPQEIQEKDAF